MSLDWAAIEIFSHDGRGRPRMKEDRRTGRSMYDFFVQPKLRGTQVTLKVPQHLADNKTFEAMVKVAGQHGRDVRVLVYHE